MTKIQLELIKSAIPSACLECVLD